MFRNFMNVVLGIIVVGLTGCTIETPEIRGVVLDAETKQPVEGAWVHFTLEVHTKTIAGGTTAYLRVEPPHTRTNEKGEFIIPAKQFETPSFPHGFGTRIDGWGIIADTIDDREGGIGVDLRNYAPGRRKEKDFGRRGFDIGRMMWKKKMDVTILVRPREDMDDFADYSNYLQGLYHYCLYGRVFVERPPVEGGCDEWELNYVIAKHESFLKRIGKLTTMEQEISYSGALSRLGYLYKKKKDYQKALQIFIKARDFARSVNLKSRLVELEIQINEIQRLIRNDKR